MVAEFGMSPLGPIAYGDRSENIWLARELGESATVSEDTAAKIDHEVKSIIEACYDKAKTVLMEKREILDRLAAKLLEVETIEGDDFNKILATPAAA
jgi:cell division protease FtsH